MKRKVLVIAESAVLRATIARILQPGGYAVELAGTSERTRQLLAIGNIDAAVVSPSSLGADGPQLMVELQGTIEILIALASDTNEVGRLARSFPGLVVLLQPVDRAQLLDRLNELLVLAADLPDDRAFPELLGFDGRTVDLAGHAFYDTDGREVSLTRAEFKLLATFVRRPGRVLSRDQLRDAVVGHSSESYDRAIDMLVVRLRRKIEPDPKIPCFILTVPGEGYKFAARPQRSQPSAMPITPNREPPELPRAERRHLTVLSCDFVGLQQLSTRLDPEELRCIVEACSNCCSEVAARWGGSVARFADDGAIIYFSFPQAHEDDAERAVRAGLDVLSRMKQLEIGRDNSLSARAGIATGIVVIGGAGTVHDGTAVGEAPTLATALRRVAPPGSILIGASTHNLLGSLFEYEQAGPFAIDGLLRSVQAWLVTSPRAAESRFESQYKTGLAPFVGREEELAFLVRLWREAKNGNGRVALISGEPGIGKSRIVAQFVEQMFDQDRYTRLLFQCSPLYGDRALHPFILQLERLALHAPGDLPDRRLDKLEAVIAISEPHRQEALPLLAALLSIPTADRYPTLTLNPMQQRRQTLLALLDQIEALARRQPVLLVFEDAHWADPTSIELLDRIVERIRRLPVLALITFRPEFEPSWAGLPNIGALALGRLDQHNVREIVEQLASGQALPSELMDQIVAKAEGIPLFVEELTKTIVESDLLAKVQPDYRLVSPGRSIAVPYTLQDSLMARLDRLGPAKQVAQVGAAIGREFSHALLAAVARRPETEINSALDRLIESGLLFRLSMPPHASFSFKHALVQETAYGTLLLEPRRALHARIAETLESRFPEIAENQPELLARHYTEAGLIQRASRLWGRAGQRSLERSALVEAAEQLSRALDQIATLSRTPALRREEIRLQVALSNTLMHVKSYAAPESKAAVERARVLIEQAEALGEPPEDPLLLYSALYGIWAANNVAFNGTAVRELAEQFLALAERERATVPIMVGHRIMGYSATLTGKLAEARAHFNQAIMLYDPAEHRSLMTRFSVDVGVTVLTYRSLVLWLLGYPQAALADTGQALSEADTIGNAATSMYASAYAALTHIQCGNYGAAKLEANKSVILAEEKGALFWKAMGILAQGCVAALAGEASEAIQTITSGIILLRSTGATYFAPTHLSYLARAHAELGQFEEAWHCIDEARTAVETSQETWWEAEVNRIAGEIALMSPQPNATKAQVHFELALTVARAQQAKSWELRAAMSMSRLWSDQGKRDEARSLLAPIYAWFTEGFDTVDLKEAKALLDALGA